MHYQLAKTALSEEDQNNLTILLLAIFVAHNYLHTFTAHFALVKFNSQSTTVPSHAPRYSWKVGVPTFEFGTMHAILFQLGILPLTMCRLIISKASSTSLNIIIPFNEMQKYHIAIGYALVVMLFFTIVVFLMFFGVVCADGDQAFCAKFTSEIMITGYVIFGLFLSVGVTSFLRHVIPYRFFYFYHHLVFIAYAVTIAHTIDNVQRSKGGRSQAFKWVTASIFLYITDRAAMYLNQRHSSKILLNKSSLITKGSDKKMILLQVQKPVNFSFNPGQYVYMKIPDVDQFWHPFSIASSPYAKVLDFKIEVFGEKSWTNRLYEKLKTDIYIRETDNFEMNVVDSSFASEVEIMGPYGAGFVSNMKDFSHALLVGAGTGTMIN